MRSRRLASPVSIAVFCAVVTALVFAPTLFNGFVWDDDVNIGLNPHLTLDRAGLRWMLTTPWEIHPAWGGQWIPLTWFSLAVDQRVWGYRPLGYHLTNVLLHAVSAGLLCLIAARLLARLGHGVRVGAIVAALAWALHPLRVEAVAWITERRELLAGVFALGTVLLYLQGRRWASVACFAAACLSKMSVATLPAVLLVLDVYHYGPPRLWRRRVIEKWPYFAVAGGCASLTLMALRTAGSLSEYDRLERSAMALHNVVFYLVKSVWPSGLSLLYEAPFHIPLTELRFVGSAVVVLVVSVALVVWRRSWPAGLAVWAVYLLLLAPQSGLLHAGYALAADRYTYLPALAPSLLAGAGVALLRGGSR